MKTRLVNLIIHLAACIVSVEALAQEEDVPRSLSHLETGQDVTDWERAIDSLVEHSDPRVLPALLKLIDSPRTDARAESAGVLWRYNNEEIRLRVLPLLNDPVAAVRVEAAKSLYLMGYTTALPVINAELTSADSAIRARALRALLSINPDHAKVAALRMQSSVEVSDHIWAAYTLYRLGNRPAYQLKLLAALASALPAPARLTAKPEPSEADLRRAKQAGAVRLGQRLEAFSALARIQDPAALAALAECTGDLAAVNLPQGPRWLLVRRGDAAAPALARALGRTAFQTRLGAAQTAQLLTLTGEQARRQLAQALSRCLTDGSRLVRLATLRAIAMLALRDLTDNVIALLTYPDASTRQEAALTLGNLDERKALDALVARLNNETDTSLRQYLYRGITALHSPSSAEPMIARLLTLAQEKRPNAAVRTEIRFVVDALASGGDAAALKILALLTHLTGREYRLMREALVRSNSTPGLEFFLDRLRESPPRPESSAVRFFDNLDVGFRARLKELIESETALWTRVILARTLVRLGESSYARGILWALNNDDSYLRELGAALAGGLDIPGVPERLIALLNDTSPIARYAARSLLLNNTPQSISGLLGQLSQSTLRQRDAVPLRPFWEGAQSPAHPYSKKVLGERIWVLFADNRWGRPYDLFLTWSDDGKGWHEPVFTGLTSFFDPDHQVTPPTFSIKVKRQTITIALTRTVAQGSDSQNPHFKTIQRVQKNDVEDFLNDRDGDGLMDLEEQAIGTNPTKPDTDGDGLPDNLDKNPLAPPGDFSRDDETVQLLAISYAVLVKNAIPHNRRTLTVALSPGQRALEIPTFPGLVLHLTADQIHSRWQETGAGYPRVAFDPPSFSSDRLHATQSFRLWQDGRESENIAVSFGRQDGVWTVIDYREGTSGNIPAGEEVHRENAFRR